MSARWRERLRTSGRVAAALLVAGWLTWELCGCLMEKGVI